MSKVIDFLLHAFFPTRCIFCDTVERFGVVICDSCLEHLKAQQIPENTVNSSYSFAMAICPFYYDMGANNAIINLKFNGAISNGKKLAEFMFYSLQDSGTIELIDFAVPVPMHSVDIKERGFNQSEILCKALCGYADIPYDNSVLVKAKQTEKQHHLKSKERVANLIDAFIVMSPEKVYGKTILLVDDVFTTGTTMDICSRTLLGAGALKVICVAAAKTNFKSPDKNAEL